MVESRFESRLVLPQRGALMLRMAGEWAIERESGEVVVIEAETEREAEVLARQSFPDDGRFTIALAARKCARCGAAFGPEVKGGCPTCREKRDARKRGYLVTVSFSLRQGWSRPHQVRVRAFGIVGAAAAAVREAKRAVVKPRARIAMTKVEVVPMKGGK